MNHDLIVPTLGYFTALERAGGSWCSSSSVTHFLGGTRLSVIRARANTRTDYPLYPERSSLRPLCTSCDRLLFSRSVAKAPDADSAPDIEEKRPTPVA